MGRGVTASGETPPGRQELLRQTHGGEPPGARSDHSCGVSMGEWKNCEEGLLAKGHFRGL